jgi:hypothetical protein
MKSLLTGGALSVVMFTAAAAQPDKEYDLNCTGMLTSTVTDGSGKSEAAAPVAYTMQLHVDLNHNAFCQDACGAPERIWKILPTDIVFRSASEPQLRRLWVADDGEFSNTWVERAQQNDKSVVLKSAQGGCVKVLKGPSPGPAPLKLKTLVASSSGAVAQAPIIEKLSESDITALIDLKNHRPISAGLHTHLHALGLVHLQDDLWVLTRKGDSIITGDTK